MSALYPPNVFPTAQVSITTSPTMVGGNLQGQVVLQINNQGSGDCYIYANGDGTKPTALTVTGSGSLLAAGGTTSKQGVVQGLGVIGGASGSYVSPQYWACCATGSTTLAVDERLSWSEERA